MTDVQELKNKWFVDGDFLKSRLEPLVAKANCHCKITKEGTVIILDSKLPAKEQVQLVLSARAIAAQMDSEISAEVTAADISKYTGLPTNQVRARANDTIKEKFAVASRRGTYRAIAQKVEPFLDAISHSETADVSAKRKSASGAL
jgi:hypothetical protein